VTEGGGYRSPLTAGGLLGCAAALPFFLLAFALLEDALHSAMPWWHWLLFSIAMIAVPAAILAAVKWCVDRAVDRRPDDGTSRRGR
jgi:hypothetical protein